jgi:hypothetical protein
MAGSAHHCERNGFGVRSASRGFIPMAKYRETKSRNSIRKVAGNKVTVRTKIPANTCHPGVGVRYHAEGKPPTWYCQQCGKVILVETPVNNAVIIEP